jgi:hypothetical protein
VRTLSHLLIVAIGVGFDGRERKRPGQRRPWATRLRGHRRPTGIALQCAEARREEPRRGRGDGVAGGDIGEALEGRR